MSCYFQIVFGGLHAKISIGFCCCEAVLMDSCHSTWNLLASDPMYFPCVDSIIGNINVSSSLCGFMWLHGSKTNNLLLEIRSLYSKFISWWVFCFVAFLSNFTEDCLLTVQFHRIACKPHPWDNLWKWSNADPVGFRGVFPVPPFCISSW